MDAAAVSAWLSAGFARLAIWRGYESDLETLMFYAVGIAVYTALVFAFYENISRVDAFTSAPRPGWRGRLVRFVQSAFVFPVVSMLYFAVLAASLFLLANPQEPTYQILTLSMAVVLSVRITALLNEGLSSDIAKLLPLGLLGVLLVNPGAITVRSVWTRVLEVPTFFPVLLRYFALFVAAEAVLRGIRAGSRRIARGLRAPEPAAKNVEVQAPAPAFEPVEPPVAPKV